MKENPKFVYRRLLKAKLSAKTEPLDRLFKAKFWNNLSDEFDNYFSIFLDLL